MAKIFILIALLLQLCTMHGLSPCSKYYTCIAKSGTNEILGQIKIPSLPQEDQYHLRVDFQTYPLIHEIEPVARLELAQPVEETIQAVQQGRSLLYHVHFPLGQAIPRLTKIWFIDRQICSSTEETEKTIISIEVVYPLLNDSSSLSNVKYQVSSFAAYNFKNTSNIYSMAYVASARSNNSNEHDECGIRNYTERINLLTNYGEQIMPGEWPWLVALFYVRTEHKFKCAGSILTNKHIITAAHCLKLSSTSNDTIDPNVLVVALGRFNLSQWDEEGSINREVASYKIHPDYAHTITSDSNMAILTLKTSVEFNSFIRPVCLWTGSTNLKNVVNQVGLVVGWGEDELGFPYTEDPRMVRMPIVSQETCLRSHQVFNVLTSERTFCAGFRNLSGPCNGDAGSGLILFNATTNQYQLRGVVSRALGRKKPSCDLQNYVVYVDVAKYIPWIQEQISII